MRRNEEGFAIPYINEDNCIDCKLCEKVCVHLNEKKEGAICGSWMYSSKDENAKAKSSSGAAWYEIGKKAITDGRSIVGSVWTENLVARHEIGETAEFLTATQGSKYVQSDMGEVLKKIVQLLQEGRRIVFSGTPCQAMAAHNVIVNSAAVKYRENALIIGVICHGVASPLSWESYKTWDEARHNSKLISVNFRDKSRAGYKKCYCRYEYASGEVIYLPTYFPSSKWMESTIVYNLAMRNSCAHCDCKGINSAIDLVLGDWYAEYTGEGAMGTSCIVAYTERGVKYIEESLNNLKVLEYKSILEKNSLIEKSSIRSSRREDFFKNIMEGNIEFWNLVEKLYPPKYKYKRFLVKIGLYDVIKQFTRRK